MKKMKKTKKRNKVRRGPIIELIVGSVVFAVAVCIFAVCKWLKRTFGISFTEFLYTLVSPLNGSDTGVVFSCLRSCIPAFGVIGLYIAIGIGACRVQRKFSIILKLEALQHMMRIMLMPFIRHCMTVISVCSIIFSIQYADQSLQIGAYLKARMNTTTIYEDYYVDPDYVNIGAGERTKNLIYIYMESMETTYASEEAGGRQTENYIPNLTALARENCSFSNSGQLGGFRAVTGTGWTMGSLFSTTSGVPYAFPVDGNSMGKYQNFASGVTTLGDILKSKGYQNEFLCGSNGDFAGRKEYFLQHGEYEVFDYFTAQEKGYIAEDYKVWWGYEDEILYEIAKDELLRLAQTEEPFNFTMLTVDTHHIGGYICDLCGDDYESGTANVVACADRQAAEFIQWCQEQDFYKDTVIVIIGDHPRMDNFLVDGVEYYDRTVYNCILNCDLQGRTENREFTAIDMFPTTLSAMGFHVEGEHLGLGVNLFSDEETLCESLGFETLDTEFQKYSDYYVKHFA